MPEKPRAALSRGCTPSRESESHFRKHHECRDPYPVSGGQNNKSVHTAHHCVLCLQLGVLQIVDSVDSVLPVLGGGGGAMFGRALHIRKVIANIPDSGRGRDERWSRLDISAELICISESPHHTSLSRHTRNTAGILPRICCKRSPNCHCQCYSFSCLNFMSTEHV